ncbi:MAG TPA: hypothetical protein VFK48_04100 [Usitatibacter sp.]|nr:hypothetical protein [Usitatibacter sp.]
MKRGLHHALCALALAALAAGCGGGGGGISSPPNAGLLDLAFGAGGRLAQAPHLASQSLQAMVVDAAGNVFVTGSSSRGDFGVVKVNANGIPDPAFGVGGRSDVDIDGNHDQAVAIEIDDSGNLYVAGTTSSDPLGRKRFVVVKLRPDGTVAQDFGVGGRAVVEGAQSSLDASGLMRDSQGNLYVTGTVYPDGGGAAFAVAKLDAGGQRVTGFGAAGLLTIVFEQASHATANKSAVARDRLGNMYMGGTAFPGPGPSRIQTLSLAIAKIDPAGNLVAEFAGGGKLVMPVCPTGNASGARALAVDRDDGLYVAASTTSCGHPVAVDTMLKLDRRGQLVGSFGNNGVRYGTFGTTPADRGDINAIAVGPDGGIFVAGNGDGPPGCQTFRVAKLDSNGGLAPGFASNGVFRGVLYGIRVASALALAFDPEGRLYVGGDRAATCSMPSPFFELIRLK